MKRSHKETEFLKSLKDYFKERRDIAFAFLFGSTAKGRIRKGGDVDVEWEAFNKRYEGESRIALDLERLLKTKIGSRVLLGRKDLLQSDKSKLIPHADGAGTVSCFHKLC